MTKLFDCLCHIARACKSPSVKSLHVSLDTPSLTESINLTPQMLCTFIAILNDSLLNSSITKLDLDRTLCFPKPVHHRTLTRALRKDPSISLQSLRRSNSLCDLTLLDYEASFSIRNGKVFDSNLFTERTQSCPDLLDISTLKDVHSHVHAIFVANHVAHMV